MEFIHAREYLNRGQSFRVDCDTECNITVTDDLNFERYRSGDSFQYYGGFRTHFPTIVTPPHSGYWNLAIDLAGGSAGIRYSIAVVG